MSADLTWLLVKDNSSFLVKRNGVQFTTEPNNLTNLNSFKNSGLANSKVVGISANPSGKGVILSTKKQSVAISGSSRKAAKTVVNVTARSGYRADLRKAALGRLSAILAAQKPKKITKKAGRCTLRK
ncbi:hypothetical protein K7432_004416 [Basidiobolus ranarum]|uniref:Ribosomal eL28/Mak16 domain-containing protein n=1 Tax=Basidiobolus ranarum TaxID=34480 RepID=A0ABR2WY80_9FUNG